MTYTESLRKYMFFSRSTISCCQNGCFLDDGSAQLLIQECYYVGLTLGLSPQYPHGVWDPYSCLLAHLYLVVGFYVGLSKYPKFSYTHYNPTYNRLAKSHVPLSPKPLKGPPKAAPKGTIHN